jgi:hypothetical protein
MNAITQEWTAKAEEDLRGARYSADQVRSVCLDLLSLEP